MGETRIEESVSWLTVHQRNGNKTEAADGCISSELNVAGTYIHGLFDTPAILDKWLAGIGVRNAVIPGKENKGGRDRAYALLKAHFEENIDVNRLLESI